MDGQRFDDFARLLALPIPRRRLLRGAMAGVATSLIGGLGVGCSWDDDGWALSCDACETMVNGVNGGTAFMEEEICAAGLANLVKCKGNWYCTVAVAGVCMILGTKGDVIGKLRPESVCSSSWIQQLLYFMPMEQPPCGAACEDHEEICASTGECVPKCPGDQTLHPLTCGCVGNEAVADGGQGDQEQPAVPLGQPAPGSSEGWQFVVPDGHVLIMSTRSASVNRISLGTDWVLTALPERTPVSMTVDDGSWTIVDTSLARAYYCSQLASTGPDAHPYSTTSSRGLAEWGTDPCGGGSSAPLAFNAYQSPYYAHRLRWDASWSVTMSSANWLDDSERGYDQIQLKNGTSVVAVTGTGQWSGDGQQCLNKVAEGIGSLAGSGIVARTTDADDRPLGQLPGYEEAAVYRYAYTDPAGWSYDRLVYVDCIAPPGSGANIVFLFDAPADRYDEQRRAVEQTLEFEIGFDEA